MLRPHRGARSPSGPFASALQGGASRPPYGTSTTTLKNRNAGLPPDGTAAHGPFSVAAPLSVASRALPVQRFVFGVHSTFGPSALSSLDTMRKSFVASAGSSPSA